MFKNKSILIFGSFILLIFAVTLEAGASTKFISIKAGSQYFNQDVEIAKTKAEQDQRANVFGISFDTRLQYFTWGVSITGFENDWKAKQPSTRTDGSYKVLTVSVDFKKYFRLGKDLFFYGGGGIGVSRIDSRYTKDGIGRSDNDALFTMLGTLGIEWRFDTHAIFLDSQWFGMDGNSNINSSGSNHRDNLYPSTSGPRLMLGIGFFF